MRRWLAGVGVCALFVGQAQAKVLYVGPLHQYKLPSETVNLVQPGDVVEIEPGEYYDCVHWNTDGLSVIGRGAGAVMTDTQCAGKASFIVNGDEVLIRNITFTRIRVPDRDGAGIRHQGMGLTVENCRFINNEAGLVSTALRAARITIRDSAFTRNGVCGTERCSASIEVPAITVLRVERSRFDASRGGPFIRSTAARTVLLENQFNDEAAAIAGPLMSTPGNLRAEANRFVRGEAADAAPAFLVRSLWATPELVLRDNVLAGSAAQPAPLLRNLSSAEPVAEGNSTASGDWPVSNAGLLNARARDAAHRGIAAAAWVATPFRNTLRLLERLGRSH